MQPFLTLVPSLCMVIEEDEQYVRVEDGTEDVAINGECKFVINIMVS